MWVKFSRIILRNRLIILIILGLVTAFMGYRIQFVSMSYQLAQMLPKSDNTYLEYQDFKKTFGKDGSIVVVGIDDERLIFIFSSFSFVKISGLIFNTLYCLLYNKNFLFLFRYEINRNMC